MPAAVRNSSLSRAFSTKAREVTTCLSPAGWAQASRVAGPLVKLSTVGTLPSDHRLNSVTGAAATLGRRTPTRGFATGRSLRH